MPDTEMTPELREQRLRELRRVIEAAPEDRLHMHYWTEQADCGTAHCAAGWAALDPWFREHTEIGDYFSVYGEHVATAELNGFEGLELVFGLGRADTRNLFAAGGFDDTDPHAITKAEVLANIDRLLAGEPAERYAIYDRY